MKCRFVLMTRMGSPCVCVCDRFIVVFGWTNVVPTLHIAANKPEVVILSPAVVARWLTSADNCFSSLALILCHAVVILVAAMHAYACLIGLHISISIQSVAIGPTFDDRQSHGFLALAQRVLLLYLRLSVCNQCGTVESNI